MKNAIIEKVS